jgi:hypothetical protein
LVLTSTVPESLNLVVNTNPGQLSGSVVEGTSARRVSDLTVVVVSTDRTLWFQESPFIRWARTTPNGEFSFTGLPQGEYALSTLAAFDESHWPTADQLEQVLRSGGKATTRPGERTEYQIVVPPAQGGTRVIKR